MNKRPNLLLILSDDQGAWALGCAGNQEIRTPNLDALAASGMQFNEFYCVSPVCSPARASIFTGRIPSAHGIQDWLRGGNLEMSEHPELADDPAYACEKHAIRYLDGMPTFVDLLSAAGYDCSLCGKWHMGDSLHPQHGFRRWRTIARGGCPYYHPDLVRDGKVEFANRYITDIITDDALGILEQSAGAAQPFYLSVHYTAPHSPWDAANHPAEFLHLYDGCRFDSVPDVPLHPWLSPGSPYKPGPEGRRESLRGYYAAISAMDAGIGRLLERLERLGLRDDTLVVFTSDNGMNMGHHGIWGKGNGTFPQNMYDSSVKVPFLASLPERIPSGVKDCHLLSHYDLFPTLAELLELPGFNPEGLPGKSFAPLLCGGVLDAQRPVVVFDEYGPVRMIRTGEWKYVCRLPYGPDELYNLSADPGEEHNLALSGACAPRRLAMRAQLMRWFARYADPALDGSHECNTGYGQLCRVGQHCTEMYDFAEEAAYRMAFCQAIDTLVRPHKDQPGT